MESAAGCAADSSNILCLCSMLGTSSVVSWCDARRGRGSSAARDQLNHMRHIQATKGWLVWHSLHEQESQCHQSCQLGPLLFPNCFVLTFFQHARVACVFARGINAFSSHASNSRASGLTPISNAFAFSSTQRPIHASVKKIG